MIYLQDFFRHISMVRGLSPCTLETYQVTTKQFSEWLQNNRHYDCDEVTMHDIADFLASERERGCTAATCNIRLSALRVYFDYLCRFHGLPGNPTADIRPMKKPKSMPESIDENTMQKILSQFDMTSWHGARAFAIIITLYMCGFRISELRTCRRDDVNFNTNMIRVHGKGNKTRQVPMSSKVTAALRNWLQFRMGECPELFTDNHGNRLTDDQLRYVIRRALAPFVPARLAHPHALRHTFATTLIQHSVPLTVVSSMLGHSSLATTFVYISAASLEQNPFDRL